VAKSGFNYRVTGDSVRELGFGSEPGQLVDVVATTRLIDWPTSLATAPSSWPTLLRKYSTHREYCFRSFVPRCWSETRHVDPFHTLDVRWPGGVIVNALDLRLEKSRIRVLAVPLSDTNHGQVVRSVTSDMWRHRKTLSYLHSYMYLLTCASVTKQYNLIPVGGGVMPCSWEGNRGFGVALASQTSVVYRRPM